MAYINHLKIYNPDPSRAIPTFVELDGKKLSGVTGIHFEHSVDSIPKCVLEVNVIPDINMYGVDTLIEFSPGTIEEAKKILETVTGAEKTEKVRETITGTEQAKKVLEVHGIAGENRSDSE